MTAIYDRIGIDYGALRKPEPRIARLIRRAIGRAETLLNVGAGTGSYEPRDRRVTALEPSVEMIRQRAAGSAPVVQGQAEALPFGARTFDAAMAVLTVHHWTDPQKGLAEMRRVARGPVAVLTFDPSHRGCWLTEYFPELVRLDERIMPTMADFEAWLGPVEITVVPVPHDCADGFLYAYWRRPSAYLEPRITAAMSSFQTLADASQGLRRLSDDLASGVWARRNAGLLALTELDVGYRLVTAK